MSNILNFFSPVDHKIINKLIELDSQQKDEEFLVFQKGELSKVKLCENHEPILPLQGNLDQSIVIKLGNLRLPDVDDNERMFLRKTVIKKLNQAQSILPKGYHLVIRDAFRSEGIVWKLYQKYWNKVKEDNPNFSDKEIDIFIRGKLAMPDDNVPPGHMTGAAVDVELCDDSGQYLLLRDAGTNMISSPKHQHTFCPNLPKEMHKNRMLLYRTMTKVGFSNFFREYWHYSYGDAYWALKRKKKIAIYGVPKINK